MPPHRRVAVATFSRRQEGSLLTKSRRLGRGEACRPPPETSCPSSPSSRASCSRAMSCGAARRPSTFRDLAAGRRFLEKRLANRTIWGKLPKNDESSRTTPRQPRNKYRVGSGRGAGPPPPSRRFQPISTRVWSVARSMATLDCRTGNTRSSCISLSFETDGVVHGARSAPRSARGARAARARPYARARAAARVEPRSAAERWRIAEHHPASCVRQ